MKKILVSILLVLGLVFSNMTSIYANSCYYEETIEIIEENMTRSTSTKTAKKTGTYKNSSGAVQWSVTVTGTFSYNGSTSSCTKSTVSTEITNTSWKVSSSSASKSGNKATAHATMKCYLLGNVIDTVSKTVTLTCDQNGNLS